MGDPVSTPVIHGDRSPQQRSALGLRFDMTTGRAASRTSTFRNVFQTVIGIAILVAVSGCVGPFHERVLFTDAGMKVGLQTDPTAKAEAAQNRHPVTLAAEEMGFLLSKLQVSGYSGTLLGLLMNPRPFRVFDDEEIQRLAGPIARAFGVAGPQERVFFQLANVAKPYERDRTAGSLFVRGPYLHVIVTDHYKLFRADPGGGEERDPRDMKGMTLSWAEPLHPATLLPHEEPEWGAFEPVHISLNLQQALQARFAARMGEAVSPVDPSRTSAAPKTIDEHHPAEASSSSIEELTRANQELRKRLDAQEREIEFLRAELDRLRKQLGRSDRPPSPSRPTPCTSRTGTLSKN
ncbi:MAG: hypothetical protein KatS3mg082_0795 [Nitrospiraceae bacterium]|nr:MAG: hypothetical protein KatS3mg082_0795 [Nitrospiraceae bacterium]